MSRRFIGPLLCGGMLLLATAALAGDPVPGVDVGAGKNPSGQLMPAYNTMCRNAGGVPERHPTGAGMWQCVTPASAGKAGKAGNNRGGQNRQFIGTTCSTVKHGPAKAISDNNSPRPTDRKLIPGGFGSSNQKTR